MFVTILLFHCRPLYTGVTVFVIILLFHCRPLYTGVTVFVAILLFHCWPLYTGVTVFVTILLFHCWPLYTGVTVFVTILLFHCWPLYTGVTVFVTILLFHCWPLYTGVTVFVCDVCSLQGVDHLEEKLFVSSLLNSLGRNGNLEKFEFSCQTRLCHSDEALEHLLESRHTLCTLTLALTPSQWCIVFRGLGRPRDTRDPQCHLSMKLVVSVFCYVCMCVCVNVLACLVCICVHVCWRVYI